MKLLITSEREIENEGRSGGGEKVEGKHVQRSGKKMKVTKNERKGGRVGGRHGLKMAEKKKKLEFGKLCKLVNEQGGERGRDKMTLGKVLLC